VELSETVYAFDSTTIDLCLALFPWGKFRRHKSAVKLHTLLDLRGSIPTNALATHPLLRCRAGLATHLPDQQFSSLRLDHRPTVPGALVGGIVLLLDRTAPAHQGLLRDQRERGVKSDAPPGRSPWSHNLPSASCHRTLHGGNPAGRGDLHVCGRPPHHGLNPTDKRNVS
jgi:hypothetical protein